LKQRTIRAKVLRRKAREWRRKKRLLKFICPECDNNGERLQYMKVFKYSRGPWIFAFCPVCYLIQSLHNRMNIFEGTDVWHNCLDRWEGEEEITTTNKDQMRTVFHEVLKPQKAMNEEKLIELGLNIHFVKYLVYIRLLGRFKIDQSIFFVERNMYDRLDGELVRKLD